MAGKGEGILRTFLSAVTFLLCGSAGAAQDLANGERLFLRCKFCHRVADGDNIIVDGGKLGPNLFGVVGRRAGGADFDRYGDSIRAAGAAGLVWDEEKIAEFVVDPGKFLKDTLNNSTAKSSMTFRLKQGGEDVAAYIASLDRER